METWYIAILPTILLNSNAHYTKVYAHPSSKSNRNVRPQEHKVIIGMEHCWQGGSYMYTSAQVATYPIALRAAARSPDSGQSTRLACVPPSCSCTYAYPESQSSAFRQSGMRNPLRINDGLVRRKVPKITSRVSKASEQVHLANAMYSNALRFSTFVQRRGSYLTVVRQS